MTNLHCDLGSLKKLLKIARGDLRALRADLADIVGARASAQNALEALDEQACAEEALIQTSGDANITCYLNDVRERKCNLNAALMALNNVETDARSRLESAMDQVCKFEQLIERNAPLASCEEPVTMPLTAGDVFTSNPRAG